MSSLANDSDDECVGKLRIDCVFLYEIELNTYDFVRRTADTFAQTLW